MAASARRNGFICLSYGAKTFVVSVVQTATQISPVLGKLRLHYPSSVLKYESWMLYVNLKRQDLLCPQVSWPNFFTSGYK